MDFSPAMAPLFAACVTTFFAAMAALLLPHRDDGKETHGRKVPSMAISMALLGASVAVSIGGIVWRWTRFHQPPFQSLFESMWLLGVCLGALGLALTAAYRSRILLAAMSLGSFAATAFALAKFDPIPAMMPPSLRSVWFIPHVALYFFGYAFLAFAAASAAIHLWKTRERRPIHSGEGAVLQIPADPAELASSEGTAIPAEPAEPTEQAQAEALPDAASSAEPGPLGEEAPGEATASAGLSAAPDFLAISDKAVRTGLFLIALAMCLGSVWARSAWGDHWAWDPKECWALSTCLFYAAYLLYRRGQGNAPPRRSTAWLPIVGIALVAFTYLGVGLLPSAKGSVHVYAAPPSSDSGAAEGR